MAGPQAGQLLEIRRTTTFRLTALLGLAFLGAIVGLLGLVYGLTARELTQRTEDALLRQTQGFAAVTADRLVEQVRMATANDTSGLTYVALQDADGRQIAGDFSPTPRPDRLPAEFDMIAANGRPLRVLATKLSGGRVLLIGRDVAPIGDLRHRALTILVSSGAIAIVLVLVAAILLSIAPLRRTRRLTALATRIGTGDLSLRMPVSPRGDELDHIAATINAMVEEIARLLDQVKGATDAIAHDLRAPLAGLRQRLDAARRQGLAAQSLAEPETVPSALGGVLETALDDLDMVLARFNALLRIAELEAANRQAGFDTVDLMTLAASVCELFEPLAEERGVTLQLSGGWGQVIHGDERLLFEAVSNLVENAIKFIDSGSHVIVSVENRGGIAALAVRDDGPGIPFDERAQVLRRFHRGNAVRHVPGSGLGLSLVASIVHLHGFALEMNDANPGLEVRISCIGDHGRMN
jgi:signal transduction histidine kinase